MSLDMHAKIMQVLNKDVKYLSLRQQPNRQNKNKTHAFGIHLPIFFIGFTIVPALNRLGC